MSDQEFIVRIPARIERKKYHIMKFNASMNVDVGKWSQVNIYIGQFKNYFEQVFTGCIIHFWHSSIFIAL